MDTLVKDLHKLKTDIMMSMVNQNMMPPRPGVYNLMAEAAQAGVQMAICSTSNERAVKAVLKSVIDTGGGGNGPAAAASVDIPVFAGDVVPKKKPDPAIYCLAARELIGKSSQRNV